MHDHTQSHRRPLEGSRFQPGHGDLPTVPFAQLLGRRIVVLEKLDGADARVWCDGGELRVDGPDHQRLHAWASRHHDALHAALRDRWELHGMWFAMKRIAFYDALPAWFVVLDVVDREREAYVTSARRREILADVPVVFAPVLHEGTVRSLKAVHAMVGPSRYKSPRWRESLRQAASAVGLDVERVVLETDPHDDAAGLHIDIEGDDIVLERVEFVRASFGSAVLDPDGDERQPLTNALALGVAP